MQKTLKKLKNLFLSFFLNRKLYLPLYWYNGEKNFGDDLNVFLVEKLSQKKVISINPKYFLAPHYFCIGSILERINHNSIIWGSGLISEKSTVKQPKKVYAVRGPKTRELFLKNNIDCPEVYGDPALLLPLFYTPSNLKKYKIGVIPHYIDKEIASKLEIFNNNTIKIIDIQQENIFNFVEEVSQCEIILSSSLHGLIIADAYNVPNIWIKFSGNILGGNFKFYDYFESVGRNDIKACIVNQSSLLEDIISSKKAYAIKIDLLMLLQSCPFIDREILNILTQKIKTD